MSKTKNIKRIPGKAESMKYDGQVPDNVKIFDPGSMATLFKPQHIFVYEEAGQKIGFVYREYGPGDDLLVFDKGLIERDNKINKDIVDKTLDESYVLNPQELIELYEFNRHESEIRDTTLKLCCVEPILTDEILASLSEDCKTQFYREVMKGVRSNTELVREFPEEDSGSET